jgi:NOL1/NOP2/fmu family ribosome biogenesis protein
MSLKILNANEKREIENKLRQQFGIQEIPGMLLKRGEERIFIFQGSFNEKIMRKMEGMRIPLERIGIYFAKIIHDKIRLSIEGIHILKKQITKNIFELNEQQAEEWMMGQDLPIETGKKDFLIMKYNDSFLGCGKASELKIGNFVPKSRRLKSKSIIN